METRKEKPDDTKAEAPEDDQAVNQPEQPHDS